MLRYSALVYLFFAIAVPAQTDYQDSRIVVDSGTFPPSANITFTTFGISKNGQPPPWRFCADCDTAITLWPRRQQLGRSILSR
jgi:hypothetical protein